MQAIKPTKIRMPRGMSWVILAAILFLMLTSLRMTESTSRVVVLVRDNFLGPVRAALFYLRWVPLFVLGAAALAIAVWNRSLPRLPNRVDAVILVFIGLALLSALYSIDPEISVLRGLSVLLMYGAVFWGVWVCADEFGAAAVMRIMVAAAGIVIGLHVVVALFDPIGSMPYLGRFRGWALNPGTPGGAAALLLPLALWHALGRPRWQHWMLVGAMILVLILSQTRSEIFAALVGSLYFLLRVRSHRKLFVIFSGVAVLVVSLAWVEIGPRIFFRPVSNAQMPVALDEDTLVADGEETEVGEEQVTGNREPWYRRHNSRTFTATTLALRTTKWALGVKYFLERPLLGFGFGTEEQLFALHGEDEHTYQTSGAYMHNSYLGLALQLGLFGAALFYVPLGLLTLREIRFATCPQSNLMRSALLGVVLTGMVAGLTASDLYSMGNPKCFVFWTSTLLLVRCHYAKESRGLPCGVQGPGD